MMGFNWLDLFVLGIIFLTAAAGFKKGFFRVLLNLTGVLAAFLIARVFQKDVALWLKAHMEFFETLEMNVFEKLTESFSSGAGASPLIGTDRIADVLHLPRFLTAGQSVSGLVHQALFGDLSRNIADAVTQGFAFVAIFLAILLGWMVLGIVTSAIAELPLLKQANKLAGLVMGLGLGLINVWILMTVVTFLIPLMNLTWLIESLNRSSLAIQFYHHNLLLYLLYYWMKA